ncbi:MAG: hypothetical protein MRZ94_00905 [Oscillospiraceae bacterium]|nr:hypothetical protein [Oscillospiraceae bacterium]MDD7293922.1 hypothetical protein [Oscillospiraceae bacterium]MDY2510748.1 hypothetical protein [Ruminococcus callidus]
MKFLHCFNVRPMNRFYPLNDACEIKRSKFRRQIRSAVCLCPLSALFCISICSLTTLNFCVAYRLVLLGGGQRVTYLSSINQFQLVHFARVAACPPCIPLAKLSQLDRSSPFGE